MNPFVSVEINSVTIKPGQTLTCWLQVNKEDEPYKGYQVELRVTSKHVAEVFHIGEIQIKPFDDWYDIRKEHP